ncbi:MAG: purine-nucleoside phosphorylase [Clostridiales bacterium]|nr:purine-nucleoside phosphorylase [Candidatus Coliplasma equi]
MATPHNRANAGEIAESVIICRAPLRVKYIAENFLEDAKLFNDVRGMYGYTGNYKGKRVSVMGHGMGIPSISIYATELYKFYGVKKIIRAGSAGALVDDVNLRDIVIAQGACTDSNFAWQYDLPGTFAPIADYSMLKAADRKAEEMGLNVKVGNIISSDVFYSPKSSAEKWRSMGVLAVEMEASALYTIAAAEGKKALCVLTISDHLFKDGILTPDERQTGFNDMIKLCLEIA